MNPLFGMMPTMAGGMNGNPMSNMMNVLQQIRNVQQNPNQLADLLLNSGKINQQQYEQIKTFNGNPQQIGEYLMRTGTLPQQQVQQMYNAVPQIQNELNHQN